MVFYLLPKKQSENPLKGPKHEIFGSGFFTLIKPIWIGDLGTSKKKLNTGMVWAFYYPLLPEIFALAL
jgi:hypothetical protein